MVERDDWFMKRINAASDRYWAYPTPGAATPGEVSKGPLAELTPLQFDAAVSTAADQLHANWREEWRAQHGDEPRWKDIKPESVDWVSRQPDFPPEALRVAENGTHQINIAALPNSLLPPQFSEENTNAARGAIAAIRNNPGAGEEQLASMVHYQWLERNGSWAPPELKVPYAQLSEAEKEKYRVILGAAAKSMPKGSLSGELAARVADEAGETERGVAAAAEAGSGARAARLAGKLGTAGMIAAPVVAGIAAAAHGATPDQALASAFDATPAAPLLAAQKHIQQGQWGKAITDLSTAAGLDPSTANRSGPEATRALYAQTLTGALNKQLGRLGNEFGSANAAESRLAQDMKTLKQRSASTDWSNPQASDSALANAGTLASRMVNYLESPAGAEAKARLGSPEQYAQYIAGLRAMQEASGISVTGHADEGQAATNIVAILPGQPRGLAGGEKGR